MLYEETLPASTPAPRSSRSKSTEAPEEVRRRFLVAGARLFADRGYLGVSMTEVYAEAGVTKAAFSKHFATKEALAVGIVQYTAAQWPAVIEAYEQMRAPAVDTVVAISFEVAELCRDDIGVRAGVRLCLERDTIKADIPPPLEGWVEEIERLLSPAGHRELMGLSVAAGVAARVIVTSLIGVQYLAASSGDRDETGRRLAEMWTVVLPGLRPTPDPAAKIAAAEMLRRRVAAGDIPAY